MTDTGRITNAEFKSFNCIVDFIEQLKTAICTDDNKQYHEVALYNHLIHKVKITNKQNIRRHISLFSEFCARNQDAILKKDHSLIGFNTIRYSEKIYINMKKVFGSTDVDVEIKQACWDHLLAIHASIDPSSKARNVLMGLAESQVPEEKMIGGLIGEISKHVDSNDERNPMAIFNSLMQSGVVNNMMNSLDNSVKKGDIDMNRLGSTIQGMMSGLMNAMGTPPGETNNDNTSSGSGLDLGNMLSSMMGLMSKGNSNGLSGTNPEVIRQQLEKQLQEEMKKENISSASGESTRNETVENKSKKDTSPSEVD